MKRLNRGGFGYLSEVFRAPTRLAAFVRASAQQIPDRVSLRAEDCIKNA
jgi:hypothetical protein